MAALIAWWSFLQASNPEANPTGYTAGPFLWFWVAIMVVILALLMVRFGRRRRPPPLGPR